MSSNSDNAPARLPSIDAILRWPDVAPLIERHGRNATTDVARTVLAACREKLRNDRNARTDEETLSAAIESALRERAAPGLRPVFNLTGTVLHTNLGRAPLCEGAWRSFWPTATGCDAGGSFGRSGLWARR